MIDYVQTVTNDIITYERHKNKGKCNCISHITVKNHTNILYNTNQLLKNNDTSQKHLQQQHNGAKITGNCANDSNHWTSHINK